MPDEAKDSAPLSSWLPASANPLRIELVDVRRYCSSMRAFTTRADGAHAFLGLRGDDGSSLVDQRPSAPVIVPCELAYPAWPAYAPRFVWRAAQMEEKWDIYFCGRRLYFRRSWTGMLVASAEVIRDQPYLCIGSFERQGPIADLGFAVRELDFLIKRCVYGVLSPHPLPANLPRELDAIAAYSFETHGCQASFGAYGDTLKMRLVPKVRDGEVVGFTDVIAP